MLDSVPVPAQAVLWPLLGAALILTVGRFLPNWLSRLAALAATMASLAVLWPLRTEAAGRVELFWEPLNFFRMSPSLYPDGLSLVVGITLIWVTAAMVLGIRGSKPQETMWHALILGTLSGCLVMTMAANLLTLALGSALLDLALIAMAVSAPAGRDAGRAAWRMAVPGIASTGLLVLSALVMDTQVGTASLAFAKIPTETLVLVAVAGILRLLIFPLHPRGLHTPENAATLLLSVGAGIYLLVRVQAISPILNDQACMQLAGSMALVAGGLLAWTGARGSVDRRRAGEVWSGVAIYQTALALSFLIFVGAGVPWPLISLTLALGLLIIWWDGELQRTAVTGSRWLPQLIESGSARARSYLEGRLSAPEGWQESKPGRRVAAILPVLGLASLAGVPLTVGARARWPYYGTLLHNGETASLIVVVIADVLLSAALWAALRSILKKAGDHHLSLTALLAMVVLALSVLILGIAPGALDLNPTELPDSPSLALGLVYVLPWLLGGLLARATVRLVGLMDPAYYVVSLEWLYRGAAWAGQKLLGGIHWLGRVGEGAGWFGWALIILALGAMLLTIR